VYFSHSKLLSKETAMTRLRILLFACMFVAAALGLCALGAATPARAAQPDQVAPPFVGVVTENANLRAGPGTTFARVRGATAGQVVEIVGCNDACDWYQLAGGDWIAAFLVTPQAPAAVAPAANTPAPAAVAAPSSLPVTGLTPAQVVSISDGDSLLVDIGGQNLVVRYLGIDSPDGGPGRERARQVNAKLNEGQIVYWSKAPPTETTMAGCCALSGWPMGGCSTRSWCVWAVQRRQPPHPISNTATGCAAPKAPPKKPSAPAASKTPSPRRRRSPDCRRLHRRPRPPP
jgi:hypothetical protein